MSQSQKADSWPRILVLIGAGIAVALQIGKVPAALPALQDQLGLTLIQSGWVVSVFSLIAAIFGISIGAFSGLFNALYVMIFGMFLTALAGIMGGFSDSINMLLVTRVFEGIGFIFTVVSAPVLLTQVVSPANSRTALALWGTYMPFGSGLMMVISGAVLQIYDWQVLWWLTSFLILVFSLVVLNAGRALNGEQLTKPEKPNFSEILKFIRTPGPLTLGLIFTIYVGQYMAFVSFLPLIMSDIEGYSVTDAALVGALVVLMNGMGCLWSSWLNYRGRNPAMLILVGTFFMGLGACLALWQDFPALGKILASCSFAFFGGLIPSTIFSLIPSVAPKKSLMSGVSGMLMQGSGIGLLTGPPVFALFVEWGGSWQSAIPLFIVAPLLVGVFALILPRVSNPTAVPQV